MAPLPLGLKCHGKLHQHLPVLPQHRCMLQPAGCILELQAVCGALGLCCHPRALMRVAGMRPFGQPWGQPI